jgi:hypothetical protein
MTQFKVKWINAGRTVEGLSRYATADAAQRQINRWMRLFPWNGYSVEVA